MNEIKGYLAVICVFLGIITFVQVITFMNSIKEAVAAPRMTVVDIQRIDGKPLYRTALPVKVQK